MSKIKVIGAVLGGLLVFGMANDLLTDDPTAAPTPTVTQSAPAKVTPTEKPKPVGEHPFVVWLEDTYGPRGSESAPLWLNSITRVEQDGGTMKVYTNLYPDSDAEAPADAIVRATVQYPEQETFDFVMVFDSEGGILR